MQTQLGPICPDIPIVEDACRGPLDGLVAGAASGMMDSVGAWLIEGMGEASAAFAGAVDESVTETTTPALTSDWFSTHYQLVMGIAVVVAVVTFTAQIIGSMVRREPGGLARAVVGTAVGLVGCGAVLVVGQQLIAATDAMSSGVLAASGTNMEDAFTRLQASWFTLSAATPSTWALSGAVTILFMAAAVMWWAAMFLRMVGIYLLAIAAPIALVTWGWDRTRGWLRRWTELVLALIFAKVAMVLVLTTGMAMVGGPNPGDDLGAALTTMLGGVLVLFIAGAMPWALLKFIAWASSSGGSADSDASSIVSPRGAVTGPALAAGAAGLAVGGRVAAMVGTAGAATPTTAAATGGAGTSHLSAPAATPLGAGPSSSGGPAPGTGGPTQAPTTAGNGDQARQPGAAPPPLPSGGGGASPGADPAGQPTSEAPGPNGAGPSTPTPGPAQRRATDLPAGP